MISLIIFPFARLVFFSLFSTRHPLLFLSAFWTCARQNVTIWYHYLIFPFARLRRFHSFPHDIRRSFCQLSGHSQCRMLPYGITPNSVVLLLYMDNICYHLFNAKIFHKTKKMKRLRFIFFRRTLNSSGTQAEC